MRIKEAFKNTKLTKTSFFLLKITQFKCDFFLKKSIVVTAGERAALVLISRAINSFQYNGKCLAHSVAFKVQRIMDILCQYNTYINISVSCCYLGTWKHAKLLNICKFGLDI